MQVHPAIAALRGDTAAQRRSQARMKRAQDAWLQSENVNQVRLDLSDLAKGRELDGLPCLKRLVSDHACAAAFVDHFSGFFLKALEEELLGEVPMRHSSSEGFARLQLLQSGGATLSLCAYEPVVPMRNSQRARIVDCTVNEIVITGAGRGTFHSLDCGVDGSLQISSHERKWTAGDQISVKARLEARHLVQVDQTLLLLQLSRIPARPQASCEYRLSDGMLIQRASGDKRASEQFMALAVLGALEHREALGVMAAFALNLEYDDDARWEAVRQVLAMDAVQGFALLEGLSANLRDLLAFPASALLDQLQASYPQFTPDLAEAI